MTYDKAQALLATARSAAAGKPVANNTRLFARENGAIALRLHETDVVTWYPDGRLSLDSGGWRTVTTKDRQSYGARVWTERGVWFVARNGGPTYLYRDGIAFMPDGTADGELRDSPEGTAERKRLSALRRKAGKYARAFIDALFAGKVPAPSAGDCFGCALRPTPDAPGVGIGGASHIESHFAEAYYVPSLLARAMDTFGVSPVARQVVASFWDTSAPPEAAENTRKAFGNIAREQLASAIRRWCLRELGMSA